MGTRVSGTGFPIVAVAFGVLGTALLIVGVLGRVMPEAVAFAGIAQQPGVAAALVLAGVVLLVLEAVALVSWARRRAEHARDRGEVR